MGVATVTVEALARLIITRETGLEVVLHDDGSRPGMYDLRIGSAESPEVAIECVGAVDPIRTETWNVGPAHGSFVLQIRGDWVVELQPHANVKQVRKILEPLLTDCESFGVEGFQPVNWQLKYRGAFTLHALQSHQHRIRASYPLWREGTGIPQHERSWWLCRHEGPRPDWTGAVPWRVYSCSTRIGRPGVGGPTGCRRLRIWSCVFPVHGEDEVVGPERLSLPASMVEDEHRDRFLVELGIPRKDPAASAPGTKRVFVKPAPDRHPADLGHQPGGHPVPPE